MSRNKYKIKQGNRIFLKGRQVIELTPKLAEELLATGKYDNVIEVIEPKKKKESEKQDS